MLEEVSTLTLFRCGYSHQTVNIKVLKIKYRDVEIFISFPLQGKCKAKAKSSACQHHFSHGKNSNWVNVQRSCWGNATSIHRLSYHRPPTPPSF